MPEYAEEFDFVVVGSGGGSMAAALVLRDAGKSVLILEKTDLVGGTTARSGGVMWIPDNRFMKRDGLEDSFEKAEAYLDALVSGDSAEAPGSTPERRRAYLRRGPEMIDYLVAKGIRLTRPSYWPDYYDELPGGSEHGRSVVSHLFNVNRLGAWKARLRPGRFAALPAMHDELSQLPGIKKSFRVKLLAAKIVLRKHLAKLFGMELVSAGMALQGQMLLAATTAGVDIRTEAGVSELIVEQGRVAGVVATIGGEPRRIGARLGVLVNAGGFGRNQAMRDRYCPGTSVDWTMAGPGDTGEVLEEMMRKGADVAQMAERVGHQLTVSPGFEKADFKASAQKLTASPHAILVDRTGVRYMNEAGSYMAYCKGMLERDRTVPAIPGWAIFDRQCLSGAILDDTRPGSNRTRSLIKQGYLHKADTIEGLATSLGMEPATLRATVERFNGFAANRRDEDFQRGDRAYDKWLGDRFDEWSASLGAIEKAPFYAVPVVPGDMGTYGGVVCDVDARVLREDGSVIEGLYATGVSTASVMGGFYPGAGGSVGPSFVWGYIAARHAVAQVAAEGRA